MSKFQSALNIILVAIIAFLLTDRFSSNKEDCPLQNEIDTIKKEFYLYYLAKGDYPKNKKFLSKRSTNIIEAYPNQFKWSDKDVFLVFPPSKPIFFGKHPIKTIVIGEPGETFEHNCKVYKAHGSWDNGYRDDYEATEEELIKAGINLNQEQ